MSNLDLAVIGNCNVSALIDARARMVWACLPRFDGDPVFCSLLNPVAGDTGYFAVEVREMVRTRQSYRRNSTIVVTEIEDAEGGVVEVVDFAPRFKQFGRVFRPMMLIRTVRPVVGTPSIRIRLRPTYDYGSQKPQITRGSNHVRYVMADQTLRLTTDTPITYVLEETEFILDDCITFVLGPDESLEHSARDVGRTFMEQTDEYWREWCRYLSVPFEWQDEVIRAAITLKMSNFEETGAIIAAMTTSIPEAPGTGRNWDYRFCWLRDSYFVVHALNRLGVTRTMEGYLQYITNVVATAHDGHLQPVYSITRQNRLIEFTLDSLRGYRGMGPVRIGNDAHRQTQNDGYGSVIMACTQAFFDQRLEHPGDRRLFDRLEPLGEKAVSLWNSPDAGLWELRTRARVHTYSSLMCWAACDRLAKIARRLGLGGRARYWRRHAKTIAEGIHAYAWNDRIGSFVESFGGEHVDASLLLMVELGFLPATDARFQGTLKTIEKRLLRGRHLIRYEAPDDFGLPETSFIVCTFWYIDALAAAGRIDEARALFSDMLAARNSVGLLSEDIDVHSGELWGNFPQTYSMVGLINSAMRLSKSWEEAF
ncbi:MAG: glycoside hydrolase family 15 protein [Alphaproteobacteria bacterium]|nr:MAG: glycoside hydrolase family 15 protein [Alphaproteobacteria bacterium]